MTQTTLWLLPLIVGSLFGIFSACRAGLRFSWGMVVQHGLVLVVAVLGLSVLSHWDWLCAYLGWGLLLAYTMMARVLVLKMGQALGLLRCEEAISRARTLRFILWGPPGRFWLDLTYMIHFCVQGDLKSAEAIYKKWQDFSLPRTMADSLTAYFMIGLLVMRDWQAVVDKYEEARRRYFEEKEGKKGKDSRFPFQMAVPAMRALNELGRFASAKDALALADLPASNYGRDSLETIFLSYFALLGAEAELNEVLKAMEGSKTALPEHARLYWQARCASKNSDYEKAILTFAESLRKTPSKDDAWRERTQYQLKAVQEELHNQPPLEESSKEKQDREEAANFGSRIRHRCLAISEILTSRRAPWAVRVLTASISIVFVLCFSPYLFGDRSYLAISAFAFDYGVLDGRLVLAGQWWRLLSYLFLHGGLSHLFMNLFGLVWFGRFVENIFGSKRFLIIFFASGVLSGLAQVLVDPSGQAVGASGAILGIFGAGLSAMLRLKNVLPAALRRNELSWMIALAITQLLFDQIVNFLFPASKGAHDAVRIAAAAHLGGMLSGFLLGWLLPMRNLGTEESSQAK